jgi:hypothetical protein
VSACSSQVVCNQVEECCLFTLCVSFESNKFELCGCCCRQLTLSPYPDSALMRYELDDGGLTLNFAPTSVLAGHMRYHAGTIDRPSPCQNKDRMKITKIYYTQKSTSCSSAYYEPLFCATLRAVRCYFTSTAVLSEYQHLYAPIPSSEC